MNRINIACFDQNKTPHVYGIWQWDYGQVLRIQGLNLPSAVEIHFSLSETVGESATRIGVTKDGVTDVVIPDSMLEKNTTQNYYVYVYVYLTDDESGQTEYKCILHVTARSKPEGRTGDDTTTMAAILKAVNEIADGKSDGLKYENNILKLLSGEKEIAQVTISGGSGGGADAREIELQKSETALQWRYAGDTEWKDLISLTDITGPAGADGQAGKDGIDGAPGGPGKDGKDGQDGADGITPHIGDNGNWYIGDTDTGKPSRGETGPAGQDGADGQDGTNGQDGAPGKDGADGKSAYQYAQEGGYTGTESEFAEKLAKKIPDKLPNPQKLTFAGGVTAEYDGSGAVTVTIPEGSGGSGGTVRIEKGSTDTTVELEPNKLYVFPEMADLSITLAESSDTSIVSEYHFVLQSGATATTLTIPDVIKIPSGFTVDTNKIYEISIMEGCLCAQSWEVTA